MTTKAKLHAALVQLRKDVEANQQIHDEGICFNLAALGCYSYRQLHGLFKKWPEFSGDLSFPVPPQSRRSKHPRDAFESAEVSGRMWSGKYGAARRRLLNFLIEQTKPRKGS